MIKHILNWLFKSSLYFLIEIPLILLGLPLVAIGIPFRDLPAIDGLRPFTDPRFLGRGYWARVRLPRWLLWWDNPFDGLWGDKRGWWDNECRRHGRTCEHPLSMWLWAAIRNPANYFSRCIVGCDVSRCVIRKLAGHDVVSGDAGKREWQFLVATDDRGRQYHRLFISWAWPFKPERSLLIDIGWKVKLSHNGTAPDAMEQDRYKGSVFTVSPWKDVS